MKHQIEITCQNSRMGRTLLVNHASASWRAWLKTNLGSRDLLVLDPADANYVQPGVFTLIKKDKPVWSQFYGSLDPMRSPHLLIASLVKGLEMASEDAVILLFAYRSTPLMRQVYQLVQEIAKPERTLIPSALEKALQGEVVDVDKSMPPSVQTAQRKAHWLDLLERCEPHTVDLRAAELQGTRLGSGYELTATQRSKLNLESAYAEVVGASLFLVTDEELEERVISRAMDYAHANKVFVALRDSYDGLICSFAKTNGEDFGFGYIENLDFDSMVARVRCTAVPPVPVPIFRIGSLRIDAAGNEHGETRPWQV